MGGEQDGGYELMEERERQIINKKIEYTEKKIRELEEKDGDQIIIEKYKRNIESYKKELSE